MYLLPSLPVITFDFWFNIMLILIYIVIYFIFSYKSYCFIESWDFMKNIINNFLGSIKHLDKNVFKLVKLGLTFCFIFCLFSVSILFIYNFIYSTPILFYIGYSLFKSSLMFCITFIICGIGFDKLKKELN